MKEGKKDKKSKEPAEKTEKEIVEQERKKMIHAQNKHKVVYEKAIAEQASSGQ